MRAPAFMRRRAEIGLGTLWAQDLWESMRSQPARIGLSFFAIGLGVAALTVLIAVLGGLEERARRLIQELGINVAAAVRQGAAGAESAGGPAEAACGVSRGQSARLRRVGLRCYAVPIVGGRGESLSVIATDSRLAVVRGWQMARGRFLDAGDIRERRRYAVVTPAVCERWRRDVGDAILVGHTVFRIIGVLGAAGGALEGSGADPRLLAGGLTVFVAITVPPNWVASATRPGAGLTRSSYGRWARCPVERALATAQRVLAQPDYRAEPVAWITPSRWRGRSGAFSGRSGWPPVASPGSVSCWGAPR